MSKSDQQAAKKQAQQQITANTANEQAVTGVTSDILGTAKSTAANLLPGVTSGYSDISTTGGYDPAILGRVNTTYSDLAATGGISEADATAMRNRASEAARSTYSTGADAASRASAATGGYGATGGSIQQSLARKGSEAASKAITDADASIVGMRQQGQIAGAGGLVTAQQNQVMNKLNALQGNTNIYGMNLSQATATVNQILENYKQTGELNNQDLSILTNLANQPGIFDKIIGTIGTLGGAAAGVLTGIGDVKRS